MTSNTAPELIPELAVRHAQVQKLCESAERLAEHVNAKQLTWSRAKGTWSIAQILDHLNRVGIASVPLFETSIAELAARGARASGPFRYSVFERLFIRILSPNPPFKVPVPPDYAPSLQPDEIGRSLPSFIELQGSLLSCLERASGLDLRADRIASPVDRRMRLSLGAWLHATVAHEQYHSLQIEPLRSDPSFPNA